MTSEGQGTGSKLEYCTEEGCALKFVTQDLTILSALHK